MAFGGLSKSSKQAGLRESDVLRFYDLVSGLTYLDYKLDELIAPVAALLLARWAAYDDAEKQAIALFDDVQYDPTVPPNVRQACWAKGSGRSIVESLATKTLS